MTSSPCPNSVRELLIKKIHHQWVLLAMMHDVDKSGNITHEKLDLILRENGVRITYSDFKEIKAFLEQNELVKITTGKNGETIYCPNYSNIVKKIIIHDDAVLDVLKEKDYLMIEESLSDPYVRSVFFNPKLIIDRQASLFDAIHGIFNFSKSIGTMPSQNDFKKKELEIPEVQDLRCTFSPEVAKMLFDMINKLEEIRQKDPNGLYKSYKQMQKVGKLNERIVDEVYS